MFSPRKEVGERVKFVMSSLKLEGASRNDMAQSSSGRKILQERWVRTRKFK